MSLPRQQKRILAMRRESVEASIVIKLFTTMSPSICFRKIPQVFQQII